MESIYVAEVEAICMGLKLAVKNKWKQVQIESDATTAIQAVGDTRNKDRWEAATIIQYIRALQCKFSSCNFVWIGRTANRVADALAKIVRVGQWVPQLSCNLPSHVSEWLQEEQCFGDQ